MPTLVHVVCFMLPCVYRWVQIRLLQSSFQNRSRDPRWFRSTLLPKPSHQRFCKERYHQDTSQNPLFCPTTSRKEARYGHLTDTFCSLDRSIKKAIISDFIPTIYLMVCFVSFGVYMPLKLRQWNIQIYNFVQPTVKNLKEIQSEITEASPPPVVHDGSVCRYSYQTLCMSIYMSSYKTASSSAHLTDHKIWRLVCLFARVK